jgi:hypothetical protein
LFVCILRQGFLIIIGNRIEFDAVGFKLGVGVSQLTELRPARGSPNCRTKKYQRSARPGPVFVETKRYTSGVG